MKTRESVLEFENLVFEGKNKDYGAFVLRKVYNKYVSLSTTGAIIIFALIVSYPLITAFIFPEEQKPLKEDNIRIINFDNIPTQSIKKDNVEIPITIQPKTPTIKYTVPTVKPDEQVPSDDFATIKELENKNPGTETVVGNPNGNDIIEVVVPIDIPVVEPVKEQVYTWLEEMPSFIGGDRELINFLVNNLHYPEIAKRAGVEGKVILSFIIDKSGRINEVEVLKGIGAGCDEEALRVINSMPNWNPGKQNGKAVITKINIPVVFKLQ